MRSSLDESLAKTKHWQIFFGMTLTYSLIPLFVTRDEPLSRIAVMLVLLTGYFGWFLLVENALLHLASRRLPISSTFFTACVIITILLYVFSAIVSTPGGSVTVTGFSALIVLFTLSYIPYHMGKVLVSVERGKRVDLGDHVGETILFFFYPLGIWLLQPRINALHQRKVQEETLTL